MTPRSSSPELPRVEQESYSDDADRYEQVAEHARGGLGRVVRAVDKRLGRTVAVKELLRKDPENEARFLREALITARLEHPGIVPVHEAGRWDNGDPYYVMKLVEGRTLKELIASLATLSERIALLPHVIAVADAVGYAHSEGVIHRDLKPSNVIVGEFGETIVVDWGLARDRKENPPEPDGNVVGTPAYMAPEQARGEEVDERADVYAIGAMLYELLAGAPPHAGDTPQQVLDCVLAGPPPVLTEVPDELATIVGKAMARNPLDRYANASAIADDLRCYSAGKLVTAHTYSAWSLLRKKLSHHRGVVAVALASAIALGAVGVESFRTVVAERNNANTERGRAEDALQKVEKRQQDLVLLQAMTSLRKDPTAALAWLKQYEGDRNASLDVLDEAIALGVATHVFRAGDWVFDSAFTPDGKKLVALMRNGELRTYDLATSAMRVVGKAPKVPEVMALSPDGTIAVTGGTLGNVIAWSLADSTKHELTIRGSGVSSLQFSRDGKRVLVGRDMNMEFDAIDLASGEVASIAPRSQHAAVAADDWSRVAVSTLNHVATPDGRVIGTIEKSIRFVELSPRGDLVLLHDASNTLYRVPYAGGKPEAIGSYPKKLVSISWSPDQRRIALVGESPEIPVIDVATGKLVRELRGHTDAIYNVEWTRDGQHLLSGSDDSTARLWSLADGNAQVLSGHDDDVHRARFSPDETRVVTSSLDGSVRVWPIAQPGAHTATLGGEVKSLSIVGHRAIASTATEVTSWDLETAERSTVFSWGGDHSLGIGHASDDGQVLVILHPDWSMEARHRDGSVVQLRGHCDAILEWLFSSDAKRLYTSSRDGTLREWDLATGEGRVVFSSEKPITGFAIADDGRVAANASDTLYMVDRDGVAQMLGTGPDWCLASGQFEPVRGRLVLLRCDHTLAILDDKVVIDLPTGGYAPSSLRFSKDREHLAGAMGDRTVRIWNARTGVLEKVLTGHTDLVLDVAFSPDGNELASTSYDKTVRVWDLVTGNHRVLRGHGGPVERVEWRDATHLVTASRDGTLRMWDGPCLFTPSADELATLLATATTARIESDRPTTPVR